MKKLLSLVLVFIVEIVLFVVGINFINLYSSKIHETHNELLAWQQKDEAIRSLQETYYNNKEAIDLIQQSLPSDPSIIPFFEELEGLASSSGVLLSIDMTAPPQPDTSQNLLVVLLQLSLEGTYSQTNEFIKKIENLEQLVIVRQHVLQSPDGLSAKINSRILLKTYFGK